LKCLVRRHRGLHHCRIALGDLVELGDCDVDFAQLGRLFRGAACDARNE
jgi:hypothetical protein